jgi:hypothetical protein
MFVSIIDTMVMPVIPPDESGGYRMTDGITYFPLSERILTQNTRHRPGNSASRSRQPMAAAVGNSAPRAAKQPGPPTAPHHAKGINNVIGLPPHKIRKIHTPSRLPTLAFLKKRM